jgi:hypothetical protein
MKPVVGKVQGWGYASTCAIVYKGGLALKSINDIHTKEMLGHWRLHFLTAPR